MRKKREAISPACRVLFACRIFARATAAREWIGRDGKEKERGKRERGRFVCTSEEKRRKMLNGRQSVGLRRSEWANSIATARRRELARFLAAETCRASDAVIELHWVALDVVFRVCSVFVSISAVCLSGAVARGFFSFAKMRYTLCARCIGAAFTRRRSIRLRAGGRTFGRAAAAVSVPAALTAAAALTRSAIAAAIASNTRRD